MTAVRTVAWLTMRQLFARRRGWMVAAVALFPFVLTFFYRLVSEDREGDRLVFMLNVHREVILGVLLPITAVVFGALAFGGEVEDGTLVYLLVRPVSRRVAVAVKYAVATLVTFVVIAVAILLAWFSLRSPELPFRFAWAFVFAALVASAIYCALFAYVGLATRRGLVFGLLYVIVFENLVTRMLEGIRSLSVREFSISVAQWAGEGLVKWPGYTVPMSTVWVAGSIIFAVALAATMRRFSRYELAERL
jgi:ABC-2 type transport system permease protein